MLLHVGMMISHREPTNIISSSLDFPLPSLVDVLPFSPNESSKKGKRRRRRRKSEKKKKKEIITNCTTSLEKEKEKKKSPMHNKSADHYKSAKL